MRIQQSIQRHLEQALVPQYLEVLNESSRHSVPPGSETHFRVVVVSTVFAGERSVQRHRRVHAALASELAGGVHALSVHAYTPEEWRAQDGAPDSPDCMGGGKRRD